MAKKSNYSEEKLLEAVLAYADCHEGKIMVTSLAKWADENIEGLEGVKYYHFTRTVQTKNASGKTVERKKKCTERIESINATRDSVPGLEKNILVQSADIDSFFALSRTSQRREIMKTRSQIEVLKAKNKALQAENKRRRAESASINDKIKALEKAAAQNTREIKKFRTIVYKYKSVVDEVTARKALQAIGIQDDGFDLQKYAASLEMQTEQTFDIMDSIKITERVSTVVDDDSEDNIAEKGLISSLMDGLDL